MDPYLSDLSDNNDEYLSDLSYDTDEEIKIPKKQKKTKKLKRGAEPEENVIDLTDASDKPDVEKREKAIRATFEKSFKTPEEKKFNKDVAKTAEAVAAAVTGALHSVVEHQLLLILTDHNSL